MKLKKILLAATIGGIMFSTAPVWAATNDQETSSVLTEEAQEEIKMHVTPRIGLNVRTGPGVENEKINAYVYGTEVTVLEITDNNWAKVTYDLNDEGYAYMCADYLSEEMPEDITEVIEPPTYEYVSETSAASDDTYEVSVGTSGSYYGNCRITHYCNCSTCCGQWAGGPTASGAYPTAGRTVAMGGLPFGTKIRIGDDPTIYTVEDRGVSGAAVDVYCSSHSEALSRGMYYADVYIVG